MSTRIGLVSDVHATPAPLEAALTLLQQHGVARIYCLGDIAGYGSALPETVALLRDAGCRSILGNHDLRYLADVPADDAMAAYLQQLPPLLDLTIDGRRVYLVHASPPDSLSDGIRLLDAYGVVRPDEQRYWSDKLQPFACDLLLVGHTHQAFAEPLGGTLVVNPGSPLFNHTCAIISLPQLDVELLPLPGKRPLLSWNWGLQYRSPVHA